MRVENKLQASAVLEKLNEMFAKFDEEENKGKKKRRHTCEWYEFESSNDNNAARQSIYLELTKRTRAMCDSEYYKRLTISKFDMLGFLNDISEEMSKLLKIGLNLNAPPMLSAVTSEKIVKILNDELRQTLGYDYDLIKSCGSETRGLKCLCCEGMAQNDEDLVAMIEYVFNIRYGGYKEIV